MAEAAEDPGTADYVRAVVGGRTGRERRRPNDDYFTPAEATVALVTALVGHGLGPALRHVWEPCCGDGAICKVLDGLGASEIITATDLHDYGYGEAGHDFLNPPWQMTECAIITNPPWGNALAFCAQAVEVMDLTGAVPLVAMLVKPDFWHTAENAPLYWRRPPRWNLVCTWRLDFTGQGRPFRSAQWAVWLPDRTPYDGQTILLPRPRARRGRR